MLPLIMFALAADRLLSPVGLLLLLLTVLPIGASFLTNLRLRHARAEVIAWLAAQPFPIDNLNTMLIGLGDSMEVVFEPGSERGVPGRAVMQPLFDAVNDDILWTGASEETQTMTVRLGVIDSKRLPARTNYQRFMRFQQVVEDVLRPLHAAQPIARVQIV